MLLFLQGGMFYKKFKFSHKMKKLFQVFIPVSALVINFACFSELKVR